MNLREAKLTFIFRGGAGVFGHAVSLNLVRRHLSETQLAVLAVELKPRFAEQAAERKKAVLPKPGEKGTQKRANVPAPGQGHLNQDLVVDEGNLLDEPPNLSVTEGRPRPRGNRSWLAESDPRGL